jgi:hypothetical protein
MQTMIQRLAILKTDLENGGKLLDKKEKSVRRGTGARDTGIYEDLFPHKPTKTAWRYNSATE